MENYVSYNSRMWDAWSEDHNTWSIPLTPGQFQQAKNGPIEFVLTPTKNVPLSWFEGVGKDVLGLASGGGQQGPVMAAHGYHVTILDNSMRQLQAERLVAERENYAMLALQADMTRPFPFKDESFDAIIHPVSNCYIEDLQPTWNECYRVLRQGGVLMAGWTNPIMYMFDDDALDSHEVPLIVRHKLPYNGRVEVENSAELSMDTGYQFSHTLEAQIGGQLKAGFLLKDFYEDNDPGNHLGNYTSLFAASLAVKV
jgi:SAM-dependent methyltransferase